MQTRPVDTTVVLGDLVSGPLWPSETAHFLMQQNWYLVAGNHDRQLVDPDNATFGPTDELADAVITTEQRDWLRNIPSSQTIFGDIFLFHGTPESDTEYLTETIANGRVHLSPRQQIETKLDGYTQRIFLCGHTHIPRYVSLPSGVIIINPGSVGLQAYIDPHPETHIVEVGSPDARYAILTITDHAPVVEFIAVPYDYELSASRARENGQPLCETWLRTGFTE